MHVVEGSAVLQRRRDERRAQAARRARADTLKGVRDSAILATLLYHGIRREELCSLRVKDMQTRQGVLHFRIKGKGRKSGSFRSMPARSVSSMSIWHWQATAGAPIDYCNGRHT